MAGKKWNKKESDLSSLNDTGYSLLKGDRWLKGYSPGQIISNPKETEILYIKETGS
jgi:hypothetical protein